MANTKVTSAVIEAGAILNTHIASGAITSGHLSGINTAAVAEGTNLYYTDTRARASISVTGGNLAYDSATGVLQLTDAEIRDALSATSSGDGSLTYTAGTGVIAYTGPSASEVQAHLSAGTGVTYSSGQFSIGQAVGTSDTVSFGNITTAGYLRGPANFTIDPAAYGDDTGTLIIAGNLQVDGTTTTINSTTLTVDDLNITLASGAANAAAANGAGITVDGASATLLYAASGDKFVFNKGLDVTGNLLIADSTVQNLDINFVNTRGNTLDRVRVNLEANSEDWHIENDQTLDSFKIRHHTNDNDVLLFNNTARANSITANSTGVGINVASAGADLHVDRVIRVSGTTSAVQIGDTNGYTWFYTGASNRFQLNYDAPFGSGVNTLFTADSSGRVVYHDQLQLAADYNTAVNTLANQSYFYVGSSSKSYNVSMESSRNITATDANWAAQNELFIVNTYSGGEASIGMSALNAGGQHHRVALIARAEGSGSLGAFVVKTRGSSGAESEKERLVVLPDGVVEFNSTKAYGSTAGSLRIRPSYTGTNYSDGAHINIVFGREDVTNNYIGEIKVEQLNPSSSTASNMEFYTNGGGGNTATKPRMTIMSNGGVEVGDGTNYGYLKVISNSAPAAYFDRRGSDGVLIQFRHDDVSSPIDGQINTLSGRIGIGSSDTGIFFDSVRDCISPFTMTGNDGRGAAIDIGRDTVRFKAGYFSGQVNASTLTATNTANATGLSFRSGAEFISGEGWCTAHGHYNYNDGTLFLNRDTASALRPVFHIAGYNNSSYHPNYSYSVGDAGMVTLTKPNGSKQEGTSYAYRGLSDSSEYSNWIKDATATRFFDSDGLHEFHNNVDINGTLKINKDYTSSQYLWIFQNAGGDGGIVMSDNTGGARNNWQIVPNTSSRDLQYYSYTMAGHHTLFNAAGGIHSLSDGGTSSAFFLAGNSAGAANGKVAMGLRDGMIQFRDPGDYYHKMWYYDGINVSTNSGHGHFRVWGDSGNSAMNNTSAEDTLRFSIDTVTGNIGTSDGATNIYNASDERLKENVTALPSMLNKINALRPISFDWKYKEGETGIYGFVAQEVQVVDDSLVFNSGTTGYRNDKTYGEDLELDGNIEDTLAINERKLFPMLVKAIQEQQTIIDDLKARIESLES